LVEDPQISVAKTLRAQDATHVSLVSESGWPLPLSLVDGITFRGCLGAGPGGGEERVDVGVACEVADDRTNGTDMELKPLGDFAGGYRFVAVRATVLSAMAVSPDRLADGHKSFVPERLDCVP
jgi:hypothetical protein